MTDRSAIEWTQATWNPVTGCDRSRPAASTVPHPRHALEGHGPGQVPDRRARTGPGWRRVTPSSAEPLGWRRPRRIFAAHGDCSSPRPRPSRPVLAPTPPVLTKRRDAPRAFPEQFRPRGSSLLALPTWRAWWRTGRDQASPAPPPPCSCLVARAGCGAGGVGAGVVQRACSPGGWLIVGAARHAACRGRDGRAVGDPRLMGRKVQDVGSQEGVGFYATVGGG